MSLQNYLRRGLSAAFIFAAAAGATQVLAQTKPFAPNTVAERNNLYCAGFVQKSAINTDNRLIGAVDEQDGFLYAQNDEVYVNAGADKGVKVGDMWAVVRPRGEVSTRWTNKGDLGFFVQEVGNIEIVRVKQNYSVAVVKVSCDSFLLGDLVQPWTQRTSPGFVERPALDRFADSSGKAMGRLFMGRDSQEMITRDQIVYVDLGAEDNLRAGDYLTIFRPLGKGNILHGPPESVSARDYGFQSLTYRGDKFSNQAARKSGDQAGGRVVTTERAKDGRPDIRKVVGEGVVLNVKERTATVVITRTAQEIHTGDWVEVQ
ncbi:MAG: hypothetical protein QUS14_07965 [Pyrinomonadaceae bacterium]|nr:hypothetical protein [Pyrinomonadaceae bacterium]